MESQLSSVSVHSLAQTSLVEVSSDVATDHGPCYRTQPVVQNFTTGPCLLACSASPSACLSGLPIAESYRMVLATD